MQPEDQLPKLINYRKRSATRRIILHESHTPESVKNVTELMRARGRVNGLLEVGYHYVIEADGRAVNTRRWDTVGSHAPGENHDSIGVCLAGDQDTRWWSLERWGQRFALLSLCQRLYGYLGFEVPVVSHDEAMPRRKKHHGPCPSVNMENMRAYLKAPI